MIIKRDCIYSPKGKNRPLHIYLPDNYYESNEHYPVMYFFDGHNLFLTEDTTYGKTWGLKEFMESWSKDMIIVGIECGHEGYERLYEYMPYPSTWKDLNENAILGEETYQWIINDIKPMIDQEYRTIPFRECTAIGGASMGGLMALYGAVHHNRWFSKAACLSSSIGMCIRPLLKDMYEHKMDPDTRIYLSWGEREAHDNTYRVHRAVADKIESSYATVKVVCQEGGGHCEADWEKLVPGFMNFLWMGEN